MSQLRIEVYYSPFCRACGGPPSEARSGPDAATTVVWKDLTQHLEAAVALGVARPPAVVMNGRLVAQGPEALTYLHRLCSER